MGLHFSPTDYKARDLQMRCIVNGAQGKMGRTIVAYIEATEGLSLAGCADLNAPLDQVIASCEADIVIDFMPWFLLRAEYSSAPQASPMKTCSRLKAGSRNTVKAA